MAARNHPGRDPRDLLPLKHLELLVLTMLANGERHGYGLHEDIAAHSGGRIAPEAGNLYRHIRRLEADGLLEQTEPRRGSGTADERRIYYKLRPFGRRVLDAEVERLRSIIATIEGRVAPGGSQP